MTAPHKTTMTTITEEQMAMILRTNPALLEKIEKMLIEDGLLTTDCPHCNVSQLNKGGCDCRIVACASCGWDSQKFNFTLCKDGELRCDDCNDECEQDGYENECDDFNLRND